MVKNGFIFCVVIFVVIVVVCCFVIFILIIWFGNFFWNFLSFDLIGIVGVIVMICLFVFVSLSIVLLIIVFYVGVIFFGLMKLFDLIL